MSKKSSYYLAHSRIGIMHAVMNGSYNATPCNSRNKGFALTRAAADLAKNRATEHYCRKCFPNGKPANDVIEDMCLRA